jgi:hypothetical protein
VYHDEVWVSGKSWTWKFFDQKNIFLPDVFGDAGVSIFVFGIV